MNSYAFLAALKGPKRKWLLTLNEAELKVEWLS